MVSALDSGASDSGCTPGMVGNIVFCYTSQNQIGFPIASRRTCQQLMTSPGGNREFCFPSVDLN